MSYKEIGENLGETINRSISGASIGAKGCYYICFGEAKTVGGETNRNIYSIGLGWGGSFSVGADVAREIK